MLKYNENKAQSLQLLHEILAEISRISDTNLLKQDNSAAKSLCEFLSTLGQILPLETMNYISLLLNLLEQDNYIIRNGIVQLIGGILFKLKAEVINFNDDPDQHQHQNQPTAAAQHQSPNTAAPKQQKTFNSLFDVLIERIDDINSFTRAKVLQTWIMLVEYKVIPLPKYKDVCDIAQARIIDKSSHVRKYAIQLLSSLLQYNPFGANLFMPYYETELKEVTNQFQALLKKKN